MHRKRATDPAPDQEHTIELQDIELQDIELQDIELQDIELQDIELQDIEHPDDGRTKTLETIAVARLLDVATSPVFSVLMRIR